MRLYDRSASSGAGGRRQRPPATTPKRAESGERTAILGHLLFFVEFSTLYRSLERSQCPCANSHCSTWGRQAIGRNPFFRPRDWTPRRATACCGAWSPSVTSAVYFFTVAALGDVFEAPRTGGSSVAQMCNGCRPAPSPGRRKSPLPAPEPGRMGATAPP